jgi:hypothetical protein
MAVQHITHDGKTYAVAFSIRDIFALCDKKNTTLEGLLSVFGGNLTTEAYDTALELATIALNAGARRTGSGESFTTAQLDDMFSDDFSLFETIVNALAGSMSKPSVFSTAEKRGKTASR